MTTQPRPRRAPSGAAVLREDITDSLRAAVFEELAASGYGRLSVEAVARRAGVGKTAVYRRWPSKLELVIDAVSAVAALRIPVPDTGSLLGDVQTLLKILARALRHPLAAQIVPDLLAEAARNPDIARTLEKALRDTQRDITSQVFGRAVERGELPEGAGTDLALDLLTGPLYWRLTVLRAAPTPAYLDELAATIVAALRA
ncbi:TetR/AcrR family transcriptional regulator [Actinomadura harenae]|uniref:TetR/AcrR family transcriptional regulator n=1 Tax=Actinomadura harenae TaxID=2483351 RepID=A0A3M2ME30_9ACTN|nr:TetR/AcrR family transcriptional regulator [Actinomadura harenae]RMI47822.1 TetR/AcrR family transcriptional regulator [Actinomadura harenae]